MTAIKGMQPPPLFKIEVGMGSEGGVLIKLQSSHTWVIGSWHPDEKPLPDTIAEIVSDYLKKARESYGDFADMALNQKKSE